VLRWEQARAVWGEVPELYTRLNIEAGIKESTARVTGLFNALERSSDIMTLRTLS
jgi:hypothetical protein